MIPIKEGRPSLATKLLIHKEGGSTPDIIRFAIEQARIYCEPTPVPLSTSDWLYPVRYDSDAEVDQLAASVKSMTIHRVIKSGWSLLKPLEMNPNTGRPTFLSMIDRATVNFLSLLRGRTIRIDSPSSKDSNLKKFVYERAVQVNERMKFNCKFDFDDYDVALMVTSFHRLPTYVLKKHWKEKYYVVTYADRPLTPIITGSRQFRTGKLDA